MKQLKPNTKRTFTGVKVNEGQNSALYAVDTNKPGRGINARGIIAGALSTLWKIVRTVDVIIQSDSFIKYLLVAALCSILFRSSAVPSIWFIVLAAIISLIHSLFSGER